MIIGDCECGAHWMQTCSWWCGKGLTDRQIWEAENPQAVQLEKISIQVKELKQKLEEKEK